MSTDLDPIEPERAEPPWYLIWVLGALGLAIANLADLYTTGKVSSLILAAAWFFWAFSWYAKPFRINSRASAFKAVADQPLRVGVSQSLWKVATFSGIVLLILGCTIKLTNAA